MFRNKEAAMQLDGSWFANSISPKGYDTTLVMPFPAYREGGEPNAYFGGIPMGFYLTRRAWEDPTRRDAAVELLAGLTSPESVQDFSIFALSGRFLESAQDLSQEGVRLKPFQDEMTQAAREMLFSCIPGVADGSITPRQCWERVMALHPFEH